MTALSRKLLYSTTFLTGASVLIFEVSAIRLLAPYYGSSLSVVSSVISVILLALSLGYYFGGRFADRHPTTLPLILIIGSAGLLMLGLTLGAVSYLPTSASYFGLNGGPLFFSLLFFFLPALLLGVDSPYVIKLIQQNTPGAEGTHVGTVFFLSTIGSIVGSLLSGFYLIPDFGVKQTLLGTAIGVIGWSCLLLIAIGYQNNQLWKRGLVTGSGFIFLAGLLTFKTINTPENVLGTLVLAKDGTYEHLVVSDYSKDGTEYRFLKSDTNLSSAIVKNSDEFAFPYAPFSILYRNMIPNPNNYLVLGGGAFTIPRHIHKDNPTLPIDVVEIEPALEQIAQDYFDLPSTDYIKSHTTDARVFLNNSTTTYDVIFSDVMNSGHYIPPHVLTKEFFEDLKNRLSPKGVAFLNYIGSTDLAGTSMTGSLINTLDDVFKNYKIIAINNPNSKKLQNLIIVVRHDNEPIEFKNEIIVNRLYNSSFNINDHVFTPKEDELVDERVFTDDRPASERLLAKQFRLHSQ